MSSTAKAPQVLQIDPPTELTFKGPFTDVVTSYLELTNPSDKSICFKVKTTAPKQYCVRPNSGLIPPKGNVKVAVMLQPFEHNAEERTSKHKFMVQTAFVPDGETSLDTIWKSVPTAELMDTKMRVVFEMPDSSAENSSTKLATPQQQKPQGNNIEAELRKAIDDRKRLQSECQNLEHENQKLRERLQLLESSPSGRAELGLAGSGDFKLMHVILVAALAVFLGLIFGKIF